jgi:hypothetical protein
VPRDERQTLGLEIALDDVEIGTADRARRDPDPDLTRPRLGVGELDEPERSGFDRSLALEEEGFQGYRSG